MYLYEDLDHQVKRSYRLPEGRNKLNIRSASWMKWGSILNLWENNFELRYLTKAVFQYESQVKKSFRDTRVPCYPFWMIIWASACSNRESESEAAQSCQTLCDPVDCSPPGSSIHGILQARILVWVAISFSRGSSPPRDWTQVSHIAGRWFNLWATREAQRSIRWFKKNEN